MESRIQANMDVGIVSRRDGEQFPDRVPSVIVRKPSEQPTFHFAVYQHDVDLNACSPGSLIHDLKPLSRLRNIDLAHGAREEQARLLHNVADVCVKTVEMANVPGFIKLSPCNELLPSLGQSCNEVASLSLKTPRLFFVQGRHFELNKVLQRGAASELFGEVSFKPLIAS